jgi:hypothetical protein
MEDREAGHMKTISNEFAALKANIDHQIQDARMSGSKSLVIYSRITLGERGVALFCPDISGVLKVNSYISKCEVRNSTFQFASASGNIKYEANNIYYLDQDYIYEGGAIIVDQAGGDVVKIGPQFGVVQEAGGLSVTYTLPSIIGPVDTIGGSESLGVQTFVVRYQSKSYIWGATETLYILITTDYPSAWENYFDSYLEESGLVYGTGADYVLSVSETLVNLTLYGVRDLEIGVAGVNTKIERG